MTRRLAVWIVLLIVFVAIVATSVAAGGGASGALAAPLGRNGVSYGGTVEQQGSGDARVATIPIYGTIVDGDSASDGSATGGDDIVRMLDAIIDDEDSWDGVILELDTPGGSVLASEEVADALRRLHRETDIPVLAWMRGTAASAGYYMAASTDRIVASPNTFTGSIGVILEYYVVDRLADKVGVQQVTIKSGKLKDIGSPFRQVTPEERAVFQRIIDEAYASFVKVVAKGRDLPDSKVRTLADGRIYTGRQAKDNGLVDVLGLRRAAYDELARMIDRHAGRHDGDRLDVVRFTRTYGLLHQLSASAQPSLDTL
ncbi:MAG: signal peptide peptidase SppA, type, partial [Thermoleophilia bacterium]|nr:signal peptide peptidase SppA, type [Thermoleophilia bacterium]